MKINLELDVTDEEFDALLVHCRINTNRGVIVNDISLRNVYFEIYNQLNLILDDELKDL